jgi:ABC-2 type transport system permease protein
LTHFVDMVRGVVLRGAPLLDLKVQVAKLLAFFVVTLLIATRRFHKSLD